jgi:predicted membrane-bound mannosyltransferase
MSSRFDAARSRVDATVGAVTRLTGLPPVVVGVAVVTVLSLSLRLAALGNRVAHFDEGRVAYWIVRYAATATLSTARSSNTSTGWCSRRSAGAT